MPRNNFRGFLSLSYIGFSKIIIKKKILFVLMGIALCINQSCSNAQEASPSELSIESVSTSTGEKVLLRLKPKVGSSQKTLMTVNLESETAQAMNMNLTANVNMKVTGQEGIVYDYEMSYNSIKMNMNVAGMEMEYDSESSNHSGMGLIIHEQMKSFFDKPTLMKMDERGRVSQIQLPGNTSSQQMGDVGSMSIPMPEEPVGEGDSWSSERSMDGAGIMKMNMKLEKITVSDVLIGTTGDILDDSGNQVGSFDGNYKLDRNSGLTKDGTMNMNLNVEGQSMRMKVNFKAI